MHTQVTTNAAVASASIALSAANSDVQHVAAPVVAIAEERAKAATEAEGIKLQQQRETSAYERIDKLSAARQDWQDTAYKTSNEMLYGILADCYRLYHDMCGKGVDAAALRAALERKLSERGIARKASTHTMAKIVRCVFDGDRRRISAYSRALQAALSANAAADGLAAFISDAGGVEELRLAKSPNFVPTAVKVDKAKAAIATKSLVTIDDKSLAKQLDTANVGAQYVLVASMQADGTLSINAVLQSDAALNAALAAYYGQNKDAIAASAVNDAQAKASADKQQGLEELVTLAAAA